MLTKLRAFGVLTDASASRSKNNCTSWSSRYHCFSREKRAVAHPTKRLPCRLQDYRPLFALSEAFQHETKLTGEAMSFAFLPFYTGDYFRDTRGLSMAAHGCYFLLLTYCWDSKGPLPLDDELIAGICNARSQEERITMGRVLGAYFTKMADGWYNRRMQLVIERAEAISAARSIAGLARHGIAVPVRREPGQRLRSARLSAARAIATHTAEQWAEMVAFHEGCCAECGSAETMMIKDHVVSILQGGHDGIDNLQPLCHKCNHTKGSADSTDYRNKGWRQHLLNQHVLTDADVVLTNVPEVHQTPNPTPTTIPTTTKSTTPTPSDNGEVVLLSQVEIPKAKSKTLRGGQAKATPSPSAEVWEAYATAYSNRYGTDPTRNARVNGQLANFVTRVPQAEAPAIAAFYVRSNKARYVKEAHTVGLMLNQAETLRTEWATGTTGSGGQDVLTKMLNDAREREEHGNPK